MGQGINSMLLASAGNQNLPIIRNAHWLWPPDGSSRCPRVGPQMVNPQVTHSPIRKQLQLKWLSSRVLNCILNCR